MKSPRKKLARSTVGTGACCCGLATDFNLAAFAAARCEESAFFGAAFFAGFSVAGAGVLGKGKAPEAGRWTKWLSACTASSARAAAVRSVAVSAS